MGTKTFVILCVIIALIGIGLGVALNRRPTVNPSKNAPQQSTTTETTVSQSEESNVPIPFNSLPSPVIPPVQDTVKEIGATSMIVTGVNGEMTLPIDASVVKVFRRDDDILIPLSLSQLKQGDHVQVNIVKPGELVHLITQ